jgi:hypothetical protein
MTKNLAGDVDEQPWTDAFEKRSTEGFEAALAPDVVLNASALVKPIVGRDLVKINMRTASTMYEHLAFLAPAKSEGRTWLERKARIGRQGKGTPCT